VRPAGGRGKTSPSKKKHGSVAFVGAGPGDPGLLTVRGADTLAMADVVVLDRVAGSALLDRCRPDVDVVDAAELDHAERARTVVAAARDGKHVVRLEEGDPFLFGTGGGEAAACAKAKIAFEIVPGVPAVTAVPSYAGIPLTSSKSHEVHVVEGAESHRRWQDLASVRGTLVVRSAVGALTEMAAGLIDGGRPAAEPVAVIQAGSTTGQRTLVSTLDRVAEDAAAADVEPPAVVVVGEVVGSREKLSWFETKPLFGWRVLVPRTKDQSAGLVGRLASYGAIPAEVPTIAVEPPRTPAAMDRAIKGLVSGRFAWVAFTSTNAVRAIREKFEELGLDARAMSGIKVAVVGAKTAEAVRAWGIEPDLAPPAEQSSAGLAAEWPQHDDVLDALDRVLLPRADIATETLAAGIVDKGWRVDDVTAYRTVRAAPPPAETREAIKTGGFDAVLFTSSSTVRNLVGIAGKPHASTVIAAIGPQTAKTAEEFGLHVDVFAPTPSATALADALAEHGLARRLADETEPPGRANRRSARAKR
jgi:uroporphyrinogen III methyltransferase/synthase